MNRQLTEGHKVVLFVAYVAVIYVCHLSAGIIQQKIYKVPYPSNTPSGGADIFTDTITPFCITTIIGCLAGYLLVKDEDLVFDIPVTKLLKISVSDVLIHISLVAALLRTDYTTMIVANSTSLLSVVLVGAFCSGVKDNLPNSEREDVAINGTTTTPQTRSDKIGKEKVWICLIVVIGVLIFSIAQPAKEESGKIAQGGALITFLLFAVAILLQGFRPDFAAQVKQEYEPDPLFLYFSINGLTACITLLISICTWKIGYFVTFVLQHDRLLLDLTLYSVLNSLGALFIYKLISIFRQHIYPLVAELRRCLNVCLNIFWYGHHLAAMQWLGICIVFSGIMIEIINNYNLASRLLPNNNVRNREGKNYNKIIAKDEGGSARKYDIADIGEDVEGI